METQRLTTSAMAEAGAREAARNDPTVREARALLARLGEDVATLHRELAIIDGLTPEAEPTVAAARDRLHRIGTPGGAGFAPNRSSRDWFSGYEEGARDARDGYAAQRAVGRQQGLEEAIVLVCSACARGSAATRASPPP